MAGMVFSRSFKITPNDRIYCTLPLYHSAGGMLGVGMSWFVLPPSLLSPSALLLFNQIVIQLIHTGMVALV